MPIFGSFFYPLNHIAKSKFPTLYKIAKVLEKKLPEINLDIEDITFNSPKKLTDKELQIIHINLNKNIPEELIEKLPGLLKTWLDNNEMVVTNATWETIERMKIEPYEDDFTKWEGRDEQTIHFILLKIKHTKEQSNNDFFDVS